MRREGQNLVWVKPKEFDLLSFFVQNPGRVFTREQILEDVWGSDFDGGARTVDVHVRWLRQKIEVIRTHPTHSWQRLSLRGLSSAPGRQW